VSFIGLDTFHAQAMAKFSLLRVQVRIKVQSAKNFQFIKYTGRRKTELDIMVVIPIPNSCWFFSNSRFHIT
jgi:hypothetical protein